MDKVEILEELKRRINSRVTSNEVAQEEIDKIVRKYFDQIEQIFEEYNCSNEAISDYIFGNYRDSKNRANEVVQARDEELLEKVNQKINKMENEVIENGALEKNVHRHSLENLDTEMDDRKDTARILDRIVDNLSDIKSHASRILANRGYSDARIEQIMDDVNSYIRRVESRQGEEIYGILKQDGNKTIENIVQEYEAVEKELTTLEQENETEQQREPSKNELAFRDSLNSGLSLEDQAENTEKILRNLEEEQKQNEKQFKDLPGDVIE